MIGPFRCGGEHVIEEFEHVDVISDLLVVLGVVDVRLLLRDLLEHGLDKHEKVGVSLNEFFELDQGRVQLLGVVVDMLDLLVEPSLVLSVVDRKPVTNSVVPIRILTRMDQIDSANVPVGSVVLLIYILNVIVMYLALGRHFDVVNMSCVGRGIEAASVNWY